VTQKTLERVGRHCRNKPALQDAHAPFAHRQPAAGEDVCAPQRRLVRRVTTAMARIIPLRPLEERQRRGYGALLALCVGKKTRDRGLLPVSVRVGDGKGAEKGGANLELGLANSARG
jgi:hypothetical protein